MINPVSFGKITCVYANSKIAKQVVDRSRQDDEVKKTLFDEDDNPADAMVFSFRDTGDMTSYIFTGQDCKKIDNLWKRVQKAGPEIYGSEGEEIVTESIETKYQNGVRDMIYGDQNKALDMSTIYVNLDEDGKFVSINKIV